MRSRLPARFSKSAAHSFYRCDRNSTELIGFVEMRSDLCFRNGAIFDEEL